MTTWHVYSGATGANDGSSWENAFNASPGALVAAVAALNAAATDGNTILIHYEHIEPFTVDIDYAISYSASIICVDKNNSDAFRAMGTTGYIGSLVNNRRIRFNLSTGKTLFIGGLSTEIGGTSVDDITFALTSNATQFELYKCRLSLANNTSSASYIQFGSTGEQQNFIRLVDCTVVFNNAGHEFRIGDARVVFSGGTFSGTYSGTAFTFLEQGADTLIENVDLSAWSGATLVGSVSTTNGPRKVVFSACHLPDSYTAMAAQTSPLLSSVEVELLGCSSGSAENVFEFHNALGSLVREGTITCTDAPSTSVSWKITTTGVASPSLPFMTPWIDYYNTATSSVTPRIEVLRNDDSTTAFTDAEVWGEFLIPTAAGDVAGNLYTDRAAAILTGTAQAAGAGTTSWANETGSCWSGKVDAGEAVTPIAGYLRGRVCVGAPSIAGKLFIDPVIRVG